jgi:hypothetical protein
MGGGKVDEMNQAGIQLEMSQPIMETALSIELISGTETETKPFEIPASPEPLLTNRETTPSSPDEFDEYF